MTTAAELSTRVPLRLAPASATFAIAIAGYLAVNLSPYMITAAQTAVGLDVLAASWLVTGTLLLTAVAGLAAAGLCAGARRHEVARIGLTVATLGFLAAALVPSLTIPGLLVGGIGAGGAVASAGAAMASFRNPDRVAGWNGFTNRGVISIVLATLPLLGLAPLNVFGSLALFSAIGLVMTKWLPRVPLLDADAALGTAGAATGEAMPIEIPPTGAIRTQSAASSRLLTVSGFGLLVVFALWAVSEDSLWAMIGIIGAETSGLTPEGLGIALSGATAGGLLGSLALMAVGNRLGRAVPLIVLLVLGGILKIVQGTLTDEAALIVAFIAWNSIYAVAYMYFLSTAAALDARGRWSGPLLSVYLVGSALTPLVGASLSETLGAQGFTLALGITSFVLAVPTGIIAAISTRTERSTPILTEANA
uniref:MFS transporter n=1 Tax=Pseudoclavibacter sp. RFBI5 TaxID=2080578 RepID=UPI0011AFD795|nr:MFS transporter [Pseudoclavibacter sp. RFBI5]